VRPSRRLLIERARATGLYSKIGRAIVFTRQNIDDLIDALSCRPKTSRDYPRYHGRTAGDYERALALIKQKAKGRKEAKKRERNSWKI
jgi:hypothetical protein